MLVVAFLMGCGGNGRSVAAYCDYFYGEGAKVRERYLGMRQDVDRDPLLALSQVIAGPTELGQFLNELAKRAPEEIAPDVEIMAAALGGATDAAASSSDNPTAALGGGLLAGLASAPAADRVDRYTGAHCGAPPS